MRFSSIIRFFLCNLVAPRHPSEPLADEPLNSLNDLIFHTRHTLPVTFDQLRSSYTDHCDDYELRRCIVTRLDFCRERRKPRHAYLVAHVAGKGTSREAGCIRIDRTCPCDRPEGQAPFSRSLFAVPVGDRAQVIDAPGKGGRPSEVVFSHTFDDHAPSLVDLIAAGLVLRSVEKLGRDQVEPCYLFAAAMFRIVAGKEYVAAETRRLERTPESCASRWFGGGRAAEHSRCLALLTQKDVQDDIATREKEVFRRRRELQAATEARQRYGKEMGNGKRHGAKSAV
ncbi:hypothetical protein L226DRAFT_531344 [Lentinus tigrinus ALCF2SS1-7]|uniref:Uncharacterized protein n=1 Tax=Lentinus tigrinus ALCF2SS1-6 TaxID=1328759 RepID=A0A5C2RZK1_9APHY|nr:hypothetical protein L227DRAFT_578720 [Lentinus tigrinus ALCF2SS1-6]RPD79584.1 hypothetical protein L226DRAFT_531344 [Lentinus tigrinus ALCF2SS1-7]